MTADEKLKQKKLKEAKANLDFNITLAMRALDDLKLADTCGTLATFRVHLSRAIYRLGYAVEDAKEIEKSLE
jgi:hypothetical protein